MRKNEQQLADELDAFLTARLQGQESPASQELPRSLTESAAELIELAQATAPDPSYLAELEDKLARAAARAPSSRPVPQKSEPPERPTFWQEVELIIRRVTMKRMIITVGAIAAVFVFAIFAWTALRDGNQGVETPLVAGITAPQVEESPAVIQGEPSTEEATPATPGETVETGTTPAETASAELALLPRMDAGQLAGPAAAGIGGGGVEGASVPAPGETGLAAESAIVIAPDFSHIFSDATFILNATLPLEPATANVQQRGYHEISLEEARQIADRFGFTGPLYTEVYDFHPRLLSEVAQPEASTEEGGISVARPPVAEEIPYVPPIVYHAFEGQRILSIMEDGIVYVDRSIQVRYGEDVANATQIAETFLQERGLLSFPFVVEQGFGGDVLIRRVVDGITLEEPEIFVYVSSDGRIASAHDRFSTSSIENLGSYPLRSAESAWQLILDGVVANNVTFNIIPDFERIAQPEFAPVAELRRFWERTYQPGSEAHIYSGPMVFRRADGDGPPRVKVGNLVLNASDADLEAVGELQGQMLHLWGIIESDGTTLTLAGWEIMPNLPYTYLEGNIQRTADQVLILSSEGDTFIIPDAPADLPDGLKVNLFAWTSRDAGLAYPVLDWQNIDEWFDFSSEPVVAPMPEPGIGGAYVDPYQFTRVTINEVKLTYLQIFDVENFDQQSRPPEYLQPAWEFSGVTDNGDKIVLRVQAVAPEFLRAP
jgi:hypothetical protein